MNPDPEHGNSCPGSSGRLEEREAEPHPRGLMATHHGPPWGPRMWTPALRWASRLCPPRPHPSSLPPHLCLVPKYFPSHCLMMNSTLIWVLKNMGKCLMLASCVPLSMLCLRAQQAAQAGRGLNREVMTQQPCEAAICQVPPGGDSPRAHSPQAPRRQSGERNLASGSGSTLPRPLGSCVTGPLCLGVQARVRTQDAAGGAWGRAQGD